MNYNRSPLPYSPESPPTPNPINESDILPRFVAELKLRSMDKNATIYGIVIFRWHSLDRKNYALADYQAAQTALLNILRNFKQTKDILFASKQQVVGLVITRESIPHLHFHIRNLLHTIAKDTVKPVNGPIMMMRQILNLQTGWVTNHQPNLGSDLLRMAERRTYTSDTFI